VFEELDNFLVGGDDPFNLAVIELLEVDIADKQNRQDGFDKLFPLFFSKQPVILNRRELDNSLNLDLFFDSLKVFGLENELGLFLVFEVHLIIVLILFEQLNKYLFGPILIKVQIGSNVVDVVLGGGVVDFEQFETVVEVGLDLECVVLVLDDD
jgi:hypothetical protein